jgi:hypothetical protein
MFAEDVGQYECRASNAMGQAQSSAQVKFGGKWMKGREKQPFADNGPRAVRQVVLGRAEPGDQGQEAAADPGSPTTATTTTANEQVSNKNRIKIKIKPCDQK